MEGTSQGFFLVAIVYTADWWLTSVGEIPNYLALPVKKSPKANIFTNRKLNAGYSLSKKPLVGVRLVIIECLVCEAC